MRVWFHDCRTSFRLGAAIIGMFIVVAWAPSGFAETSVEVVPVVEGVIQENVALIGSVVSRRSTRISAQVAGQLETLRVDEGTQVNEGDELFRLDSALAGIEVARARAQLEQALAEATDGQRKLKEAERLHTDGHIPLNALETAQTVAAVKSAMHNQRKAELSRVQTLLKQHRVRAPFTGTVVGKEAEIGQWVRTDTPVLVLAEMDPIRVVVPVPQHIFDRVSLGASASLSFSSLPGESFTAEVTNLIPQSRDGARTFPVWLELSNEDRRLAPGMSAQVDLAVAQSGDPVLLVPSDALVRRADSSTLVWVVRDDGEGSGIAQAEPVRVGRTSGALREVLGSGLQVGDLVVVRGNESLRPNQPVRILTSPAIGS